MSPPPLPVGFKVGHWTGERDRTGCTVVIPPPGTRGGVDVRGGGTGTRELEGLGPLANAEGPTAVLLTGGSAFGLAAADGVMRWMAERDLGRPTFGGAVPLVPTAVIYDLVEGPAGAHPDAGAGYAACEAASAEIPARGRVGAGTGAAVGKLRGRAHASPGGIGYSAIKLQTGVTVAAVVVANAFGDVIGSDGRLLGAPHDDEGRMLRTAELIPGVPHPPIPTASAQNTTLACVCTDAALGKRGCAIVARSASAGVARAIDPAFTQADGDVIFCLASGQGSPRPPGPEASWELIVLGTIAATVIAEALRDAVEQASKR